MEVLPDVDDLPLPALVLVVVQDDVAVSSVELAMKRLVHQDFIRTLHTPDLQMARGTQDRPGKCCQYRLTTMTLLLNVSPSAIVWRGFCCLATMAPGPCRRVMEMVRFDPDLPEAMQFTHTPTRCSGQLLNAVIKH